MRKFLLLFAMIFSAVAFAQSPDMEAMGTSNGCQDGISTALKSDWQNTLNSVMNNQSIDLNYRVAYYDAFMSCRARKLGGEATTSGISDFMVKHTSPWKYFFLYYVVINV